MKRTKKILSIILSICMLLSITAGIDLSAYAQTTNGKCGDNLTWSFDTFTGTLTISGTGKMYNYYYDDEDDYKQYCSSPFYNILGIKSVVIKNEVTSIGEYAFYDCKSLTSVTIPNSVTSIGNYAFSGCTSLKSITIPDSVTSIGEGAFCYCTSLSSITIPDGVTSIGWDTFCNCTSLTSVTIPNSVTSIGDFAFNGCTGLTAVNINSIESWCKISFYTFSSNPLCYANNLYLNNELVTDLIIPNSVTSIGNYAFCSCESLTSVTIPDSVTSIGNYAFYYCTSLTSVTIPNSVKSIGYDAFYRVNNVEYNGTASGSPWGAKSINGYIDGYLVYKESSKTKLLGCSSQVTQVTIPNSVTSIGEEAFEYCESLTSVTIPNSVTSIGDGAFYDCPSLSKVNYNGTKAEWNKIDFDDYNTDLTSAKIFCTDGVINCNHTWDTGKITKASTCTATGVKTYSCTVCGEKKTETIAKKSHTYSSATCTSAKKCTVCGVTSGEALGHTWDSGKITKASTCTATGVKTYSCTVCGEKKTETIAKKSHTITTVNKKSATCTADGYTGDKKCSVCGAVTQKGTTIAKKSHTSDNGTVTKKATCTATGTKTYKCTVCGTVLKTETIAKKAHTSDNGTVTKKATSSANGTKTYKCTVCKKATKTQTIKKISSVTLSATSYTYDGKVKKPTVIVKNSDGTKIPTSCYTVTYSNNKNVGKASVKVVMKGNYSGSFVRTFNINPKGTSMSTLTATKGGFKATWKKQATQTTGYILQYSTSSSFSNYKYVTLGSTKTLSKAITGLSKGKKYYVRVRTYKTVNGTKYYSAWSSAKAVTTKK